MKTIVIKDATKSGDGDCGLLIVSEQTYKEVMGNERYQNEVDYKEEDIADNKEILKKFKELKQEFPQFHDSTIDFNEKELERAIKRRNFWALYLDHLWIGLGLEDDDVADIEIKLLKKEKIIGKTGD